MSKSEHPKAKSDAMVETRKANSSWEMPKTEEVHSSHSHSCGQSHHAL